MKRISFFFLVAACLSGPSFAQDNAARAAAEREAAEEGYRRLNSAVEALATGQADLQRRISALADELRSARAQDNKIDTSKFVTRDEFNHLRPPVDNRLQGSSSWLNLATRRDRERPAGWAASEQ